MASNLKGTLWTERDRRYRNIRFVRVVEDDGGSFIRTQTVRYVGGGNCGFPVRKRKRWKFLATMIPVDEGVKADG